MEGMFGFKDLEKVTLKSTYNMKIGNREIEPGEIIAAFDKIQIANLNEIRESVTAHGGFDDRAHVYWETTRALRITFSQGVFSKEMFGLLTNAKIIAPAQPKPVEITWRERLESNQSGAFTLKYLPKKDLFIYNEETGAKIESYTRDGKTVNITTPFVNVAVSYVYEYNSDNTRLCIGQRLIKGFLELEGRTKVKDDTTGRVVTGIIKIPKLRLMSDLSIKLGSNASPVVGQFIAEGEPVGSRGSSLVCDFTILDDDIESDL